MRRKLTLFILTFLIARSSSQDTKCQVTDPDERIQWQSSIIIADPPIADVGNLDLSFEYTGDLQAVAPTDEPGAKYIDITAADSVLSIKTNDYFTSNYETDQKAQNTTSALQIIRTLTITCQGTSYPFTLTVYVQDTNNNPPTFLQAAYTYKMPMPLVPRIDLTNFGDTPITVEDIDFSNTKMIFAVDPADKFALDYKALGNRQYQAILRVTEYVRYDQDLELTITATDETEPFNTAKATITIQKDNEFSQPDIPTFSELVFKYTYSIEGDTPTLKPDEATQEIVVTTSNPDETSISLNDDIHFKAEYDKSTNKVTISLTDTPLESTSESTITVKLTVTLGSESSESVILIKLPSDIVVTIPTFTEAYYTATYSVADDGTASVSLDGGQVIAITQDVTKLDIQLEGDDHFSIENEDDVWNLKVVTPLEEDILKKGGNIPLTLRATVTDENSDTHEGSGAVIIKLPEIIAVPRFTEATYQAEYKVDSAGGKDTAELTNGPINIAQADETVEISLVGSSDNFQLVKGTDGWKIDVTANLEQATLTKGGFIVLTLSAVVKDSDVEPGTSTLIINLPEVPKIPRFTEATYQATYKIDSAGVKDTVELTNGPINIVQADETVEISLVRSSDNFQLVNDTDGWTIDVIANLEQATLTKGGVIVLTLSAAVTDSDVEPSTSTLIINLPEVPEIPRFTKATYQATYKVDSAGGKDTVELTNGPINIVQEDKTVDISLGESSANFQLVKGTDEWTIEVIANLEQATLTKGGFIVLPLSAAVTDSNVEPGTSTLIINLPEPAQVPTFSEPYYTATYKIGTELDTVEVDGTIQVVIEGDQTVNVAFDQNDPNAEFFEIAPNADKTGYDVTVKTNLDDTTLISQVDIVLTLQATTTGVTEVAEATLVITFPKEVTPAAFSKTYYLGTYEIKSDLDTINIEEPIDLSGNYLDKTTVTLIPPAELEGNFEISESSPYIITLKSDITDIYSYNEIVLNLEASLEGSSLKSSATVVIEAPAIPKFLSPIYEYRYVGDSETGTVTPTDGKTITTDASDPNLVTITVEDPYTSTFKVTYDETQKVYTFDLIDPLDQDTIDKNTEIFVLVDAVVSGSDDTSSATIVVKMPEKTENVVPEFSDIYYEATYTHNEDAEVPDTVTISDKIPITIESDQASDTQVTVLDPYAEYFEAVFESDSWQLTVVKKLSDQILTNKEIIVSLEASLSGAANRGTATVILSLPLQDKKPIPLFTKPTYSAEYSLNEDGTATITSSDPITVESTDLKYVEIKLEEYTENFVLTPQTDNKQWDIGVTGKLLDVETLKNNAELIITLSAHLDNSVKDGTAVLVVKLPHPSIKFDNDSYEGSYKHDSEDNTKDGIDIGTITVTPAGSEVAIIVDDAYKDYFKIECDDAGKCTLSSAKPLEEGVLTTESEIILVLEASRPDIADTKKATVIIRLPLQDTLKAPEFTETVYVAPYDVNAETGKVTITPDKPIQIKGETDAAQITLEFDEEYKDIFDFPPNGDHWDVTTTGLDGGVVEKEVSILLNLKATKDGISVPGLAGLVIQLPKSTDPKILAFTDAAYIATYTINSGDNNDELSVENGPIQINGIDDASTVSLVVEDDTLQQYFTITAESNSFNINLSEDLPSDLTDEISLLVPLKATIDDRSGQCALVVKLPKKVSPASFNFEDTIYTAQYEINDDNTAKVIFEKDIILEGDAQDVTVTIDTEYSGNFDVAQTDNKVEITLTDLFSQDVLDKQVAIAFDITGSKASETTKATVVVQLPRTVVPATFYFEQAVYMADYKDGEPPSLTVESEISIVGDLDKTAQVSLSGENKDYFTAEYTDGKVTITLDESNPIDLENNAAITVDIVATRESVDATATLIVKLPKAAGPATFYFDKTVYMAQYQDGDPPILTLNEDISIEGDSDNSAKIDLSGEYMDYFKTDYSEGKVTLTLNGSIPSDILEGTAVIITVDIVATLESDKATTTVVVQLPKKVASGTFYFAENVYIAQYEDSDPPAFGIEREISLEGDSDNTANIALLGGYIDYFNVSYVDGKVTITLKGPFTSEVLENNAAITVDIEATRETEKATTTLVVKLAKQAVPSTFYFEANAYTAQYDNTDTPKFIVDNDISIVGDTDNTAEIVLSGDYKDYFGVDYSDNKVTVTLQKAIPNEVIEDSVAITVDILASRLADNATATLIVKLPKKIAPASFSFNSTHYVADYNDDDDTIEVNGISLTGQTGGVTVTLAGDYKDHFSATYADAKVTIKLKTALDSEVVDKESAISLDIKASKGTEVATATLLIKLPKTEAVDGDTSEDKTGLIAAVAVLAVLLVASLVGSAVFYYFKFRRGSSYNDIDEGRPSERFRKNSSTDSKLKVDHPTRRATGVIKQSLDEVPVGETTTDGEPDLEKRKSVQFDTINIDELEIDNPEDDDNEYFAVDSDTDENEARRTSRV